MGTQLPDYKLFIDELRKVGLIVYETTSVSSELREREASDQIAKSVTHLEPILKEMRNKAKSMIREKILELQKNDTDNPVFSKVGLYGPLDYGRLEVAHTNTLAWLINKADHGFDNLLLKALLHHLNDLDNKSESIELLDNSTVTAEKFINVAGKDGRIDIWAEGEWRNTSTRETTPWLIVIECKIGHDLTEGQLEKYEEEAIRWENEKKGKVFYVFLTTDKHAPETGTRDWQPLSYEDLFAIFWKQAKYLKEKPGYQFLRLYLTGLLKDVQGWTIPILEETDSPYEALVLFDKLSTRIQ